MIQQTSLHSVLFICKKVTEKLHVVAIKIKLNPKYLNVMSEA